MWNVSETENVWCVNAADRTTWSTGHGRTWIVPASTGRHSSLPSALVKAHLPRPLVVQRRFVPARVAVQVHHFDVRERFREFAVVHPVGMRVRVS